MEQPTTERLAQALLQANAPVSMVADARAGIYDDYQSGLINPIGRLIEDAQEAGLQDIAERAKLGEFDGTKEEASAWFQAEGRYIVEEITSHIRKKKKTMSSIYTKEEALKAISLPQGPRRHRPGSWKQMFSCQPQAIVPVPQADPDPDEGEGDKPYPLPGR